MLHWGLCCCACEHVGGGLRGTAYHRPGNSFAATLAAGRQQPWHATMLPLLLLLFVTARAAGDDAPVSSSHGSELLLLVLLPATAGTAPAGTATAAVACCHLLC